MIFKKGFLDINKIATTKNATNTYDIFLHQIQKNINNQTNAIL